MIQDTTGSKEIKNRDDSTETAISNPVEGVNRGFTTAFTRGGKVAQDSSGINEIINLDDHDESETATSNYVTGGKRGFTAAFARGGKFQWCIFLNDE